MRARLVLVATLALFGCKDTDGDGVRDGRDCDPLDKTVSPDLRELCNGKDDDCDGQIDEDVAIVAYWDRDLDGWGDAAFARRVCTMPEDGSTQSGDCDDRDPTVHPDAPELCDLADNDCDGEVDDDVVPLTFWADADGDGFGDPAVTIADCIAPDGYVANSDDCDDGEPTAWNDAVELCDGLDNDCDGSVDEDLPDVLVWADDDGDGSGDPTSSGFACGALPGWSLDDRDCDDTDPNLGGSSLEVQGNAIDEDCDGYVDEYGVPAPYATWLDAVAAIGGFGTGTEVIQFDDGWHQVTIDASGFNVIFAGEGCDRTTLYGAVADPVLTMTNGRVEGLTLTGGTGNRGGGLRVTFGEVWATGVCIEGNTADSRGGGVAVVDEATLHLYDSKVRWNRAEQVGGGIYGHAGTTLDIQRTEVLGNLAPLLYGGGIGVRGGHAELHNVVVAGNQAGQYGGGVYIANELAPPPGGVGADILWDGSANLSYVTLHANRLDDVTAIAGSALLAGGTVVDLDHAVITGHEGPWDVLGAKSSNLTGFVADNRVGVLFTTDLHLSGNEGWDFNGTWLLGYGRGKPGYANVLPTLDPGAWDLRFTVDSELIDAAEDTTDLDPDGSPADPGAWGGPGGDWTRGSTPLWRPWVRPQGARVDDFDGDGLIDAWETRWGADPWRPDGADDPDGDGLDQLAEQAARTDPTQTDTDGDGVDDDVEVGGAGDPLAPGDHRPRAEAGPDRYAMVGQSVPLTAAGSRDPNGDALTYAWSFVARPFGSGAAFTAPSARDTTFTPDLPGLYTIEVTVGDGSGSQTLQRWVDARTGVIVPDDAATPQDAVALVYDGQGIFLRAGTWGPLDLTGRGLVVAGLGAAADVVLDAAGAGSALRVDSGHVGVGHLTLTGGNADEGGGLAATGADSLTLRDVVVRDNAAGLGGGLYALDTPVDASWVELRGNAASEGGAMWASGEDLSIDHARVVQNAAWRGGALWFDAGTARFDHAEIQCNTATDGSAVWADDTALLLIDDSAVAGNPGHSVIYSNTANVFTRSVVWLEDQPDPTDYTMSGVNPAIWRPMYNFNGGDPDFWYQPWIGAATIDPMPIADPVVVSWIDDGDPDNDRLIPRAGSPLIDAGWPEFVDGDGTRGDIGLSGGPGAAVTASLGRWDSDGDGLDDAWEDLFGLDPNDPSDVGTDQDGDGWSALDEYVSGTSPLAADSDGDGISDPAELAANTDPGSAAADRPVAVASTGSPGRPGEVHQVDGSASYDPVPGPGPLAHAWRVLATPPGSTVDTTSLSDATAANPTFVPDLGGRYVLGLVVTDGQLASAEAIVEVRPRRLLEVPSVYPTVADAYAVAESGDAVVLGPGVHDLHLVDWIAGVSIEGYGMDQTFVHGLAGWPAFEVDLDEEATIKDLTVAGGNGNYGGGLDCSFGDVTLQRVRFEFNASWEGGAIRASSCDVVMTDVELLDNDAASRGGGFAGLLGTLTWNRGVVARNSSDAVGGGIFLDNVDAMIANVVIRDNQSESGGAAINQVIRVDDPGTPAVENTPVLTTLDHVTVAGNNGRDGALYLNLASVRNSIVQGNANRGFFESNSDPAALVLVEYTSTFGNQTGDASGDDILFGVGAFGEDARFLTFDPYDPMNPWTADLRLKGSSLVIDQGDPLAPRDPDGSIADPGAYGGPNALDGWDAWLEDTDGDGLADAWELDHGLVVGTDDSGDDPDGDGRDNAWEHANDTDPNNVDSDGDGWTDDQEDPALTAWDPTDAADHAPQADSGPDQTGAIVGVIRGLSGLASSDPDGDPITAWQWTLVAKPGRSTLSDVDLQNATTSNVTFVPDNPGTFELGLVVSAGGVDSAMSVTRVTVNGTVMVPEDYDNVPDAIANVGDGQVVDIAAGTWPCVAELDGKDVTLVGAGQDVTVLDGEGRGVVLRGDLGEQLTLQDLTITGGISAEGGAVHLEGSLGVVNVVDTTITGNSSLYGGAIYVRNASLITTGSRLVDNDSGRSGGAIYATGGSVDLFQTLVAGNLSTALHGGGINHFDGPLTLTNSVFSDNWTEEYGGAIYVNGADDLAVPPTPTTDVYVDQCSFTFNHATDQGSAIMFYKANIALHNTLFAHNRGGDAAVQSQDIINTFLAEYTLAEDNDGAHYLLTSNPALVAPTDGDANGNLVDRSAELTGAVEDGTWSGDVWTLGPGSAAIDAGDPAVADPDASRSDIGATGGPDGAWTP